METRNQMKAHLLNKNENIVMKVIILPTGQITIINKQNREVVIGSPSFYITEHCN